MRCLGFEVVRADSLKGQSTKLQKANGLTQRKNLGRIKQSSQKRSVLPFDFDCNPDLQSLSLLGRTGKPKQLTLYLTVSEICWARLIVCIGVPWRLYIECTTVQLLATMSRPTLSHMRTQQFAEFVKG